MKYLLSEIAEMCGGIFTGRDIAVCEVLTDSRCCGFGADALFVAIRGANHDSHEYVREMYSRGVRGFILERDMSIDELAGCGCVVVDNSIAALQRLAAYHRSHFAGIVVGITGSNGKTVVKEWISQSIPRDVKLFRSPKSYNSQLGVALSMLMINGDEQVALIEAGISLPDEMQRLETIIKPDVTVFTSIGDAHQENFDSLESKAAEKMILAKGSSKIIYHSGYEPVASMIVDRYSDRMLYDAARYGVGGIQFTDEASIRNAQTVSAFCDAMNYPVPDLAALQPVAMRLEVKDGINDSLIIDDAYNSDINSLAIALDYLHSISSGRKKTLILSDILQSGMDGEALYGRVASLVAKSGVDKIIGIGPAIHSHGDLFVCHKEFYSSTDEFLRHMDRDHIAGCAILLKGSRASRFEKISHVLQRKSHTTVLEIDLDAMVHNLNYFRSKLHTGTKLVAMVKAGSYGAGDYEVAQMLQHHGVDYLAVAFADEGVLLRERGISMPIVVLNADAGSFDLMVVNNLEPEIYNLNSLISFANAVERYGERHYPIHIKLDTGMHRLGFMESELDELVSILQTLKSVRVASLFSHLSCADDPSQDRYTRSQIELFGVMSGRIAAKLNYPVLRHLANSAGIERFAEAQFDMCRLGLGLYGIGFEHNDSLHPVATLKTRIVQIKHLPAGDAVGYGRAGKLLRPSVTATIPVGYADGLDRHLGCGAWSVLIGGRPAPIIGRICMDSCMVDITDIANEVADGDEAVIFSPAAGNGVEDMAHVLGTIAYEVMTSVSSRVKRIYIKE